ncbi:DUF6538 domain-containing protein [Ancylobacter oerskovii]|nr:DUF6538 domain-containing protein [Ancylobacter oerskovii]MBS7544650.1 tyrosine-type recombinase/integrase [Ancylobacter oerskovii]
MARPSSLDRRHLEQKNGQWRVTIAVPRDLQSKLGTRLKRPLRTDSLAVANRLKWSVVAELRAEIAAARGGTVKDPTVREALEIARHFMKADDVDRAILDDMIVSRAEEIAGPPASVVDEETGEPLLIHDSAKEARATTYVALARGQATPIVTHHDAYLAQLHVKPRTVGDDVRAIRYLEAWCGKDGVPPTIQAITRKVAVRFADDIGSVAGSLSPVTLNKYLRRLSRYWQWMAHREHVEADVWRGVTLAAPPAAHDEEERAFTEEEMKKLLYGQPSQEMHDLMRIAALTGARLDAIVCLRVGDCEDGVFVFKPQKKERSSRAVPIHPALVEIVERRSKGRKAEDDLFPEWPAPRSSTTLRERSFKASNAFTAYRREVKVDARAPGKRRALTNFHSFRRWFITMAERADQPEHIIAAVVGHKRTGMTLGRYSAGPLMEQARRCVEAVRLPPAPR